MLMRPGSLLSMTPLTMLALACTDPPRSGPNAISQVEWYEAPAHYPASLDVLFVVDATSAMERHQSALPALAVELEDAITNTFGFLPDARIAVTTTDGTGSPRRPAGVAEPYLATALDDDFARTSNFQGTLAGALADLLAVGSTSTAAVQPLASMQAALAAPGFVRPDAWLGVVTIAASDDASSGDPGAHAAAIKASKSDPSMTLAIGVYDLPATRLDAFHADFPNRSSVTDISGELAGSLALFSHLYKTVLGYACYREPADVDPVTPGPQYDCALSMVFRDGSEQPLPHCSTGSERCYEFVIEPLGCIGDEQHRLELRGFPGSYRPGYRGQCVVD